MRWLVVILNLPRDIIEWMVTYFPGPFGYKMRYFYWKLRLGHLGKRTIIGVGVHFDTPSQIFIAEDAWIDRYVSIIAGQDERQRPTYLKENPNYKKQPGQVHIGRFCHIAPHVLINGLGGVWIGEKTGISSGTKIYSKSHHYQNLNDNTDRKWYAFSPLTPDEEQFMIEGPVVIAEHSGVGLDCRILPGVTIHTKSWISTNQTIYRDVPAFTKVGLDGGRSGIGIE